MRKIAFILLFFSLFARVYSQGCQLICNGGFDDNFVTSSVALITSLSCWSTTASDGKMEVWGTGFNGVPAHNGNQFVELNATQAATMYQDFPVTSGTTYTVCFAHRGRAGVDSMAVEVGPPGGPYITLGKYGDGTSAWGYYCATFTPTITGTYRLRFTPIFWAGGNSAIGNFLDNISVTGPASFTVSVSSPTICIGNSATLSVTGATSYSWSTSSTASAIVVSPSVTTSYTLRATAGTCTSVSVHTIVVGSLSISATSATACAGTSATLFANGAQSYTWSPVNLTGSVIVVNTPSTTVYTINATSASGCTASTSATLTVIPAPAISFTTNPGTCTSNGQATVLASGGIGPYGYSWMPGFLSGSIQNNLSPNSYTVTATDNGSGCSSTSVTLLSAPVPTLSASGSTVCTGQTLFFFASASAGVTFTWTGPNNFSSNAQNPQIANPPPAAAGAYTVRISSANGCTNVAVVNGMISTPPSLTAGLSRTLICAQGFNGSANTTTLTPGGAASYTLVTPANFNYTSQGGNPPFSISALPPYPAQITAATATLYGTSSGFCTGSITISFSVMPNPTVSVISSTNIICAGESFTYTGSGATSYTWTSTSPNTTFYSNNSIGVSSPSVSAPFSVYGSSLGCNSANANGSITVVSIPTLAVNPNVTSICLGSSAKLTVQGNADSYSWEPSTGLDAVSGKIVNAKPVTNTTYTVTGSSFGCTVNAISTVSIFPLPTPTAAFSRAKVCVNDAVLMAADGGIEYEWNIPNGMTLQGKTASVTARGPEFAGIYTLTAISQNGCKGTTTLSLLIDQVPTGLLSASKNSTCVPFCSDFTFKGNGSAVTSTWSLNKKTFEGDKFSTCFGTGGTHTLTGMLLDTITGCTGSQEFYIYGHEQPRADFIWTPDEAIEGYDEVTFINNSEGDNQVKWNWYFAHDKTLKPHGRTATYLFKENGRYTVAMIVTNGWGCQDTAVKYIDIATDFNIYVPNVFTPNGDDKNEVFLPIGRGLKTYNLSVYDRWGELVFRSTDISNGWDGTLKGKACKEDVYVWQIRLSNSRGDKREMSGRVSLLR